MKHKKIVIIAASVIVISIISIVGFIKYQEKAVCDHLWNTSVRPLVKNPVGAQYTCAKRNPNAFQNAVAKMDQKISELTQKYTYGYIDVTDYQSAKKSLEGEKELLMMQEDLEKKVTDVFFLQLISKNGFGVEGVNTFMCNKNECTHTIENKFIEDLKDKTILELQTMSSKD